MSCDTRQLQCGEFICILNIGYLSTKRQILGKGANLEPTVGALREQELDNFQVSSIGRKVHWCVSLNTCVVVRDDLQITAKNAQIRPNR